MKPIDFVVVGLLALLAFGLLWRKRRTGKSGCGGCCGECSACPSGLANPAGKGKR